MQTPEEPDAFTGAPNSPPAEPAAESLTARKIDPDNPPWGTGMGLLTWAASVLLLVVTSTTFLLYYAAKRGITPDRPGYRDLLVDFAVKDPGAVLVQLLATLLAHIFTLVVVWAVVTGFGRRPFWQALGWRWGRYLNLWSSIAIGLVLFLAGAALAKLLGGDTPTQLEQMLNSSAAARYAIAFLATLTAPLIEEFIYRGVLYSGLRKLIGTVAAVIFVAALFTAVHVPQYKTNLGVIAAVALLSLSLTVIRAVSGKLLPCFIVHLVFNGIQSALIVVGGSSIAPSVSPEHGAAMIVTLVRSLSFLF